MRWNISQDPSRKEMSHSNGVTKENFVARLFIKVMGRIEEPPELMTHTGTNNRKKPFHS